MNSQNIVLFAWQILHVTNLPQPVPMIGLWRALPCDNACKRSLAICCKSNAWCSISRILSVPKFIKYWMKASPIYRLSKAVLDEATYSLQDSARLYWTCFIQYSLAESCKLYIWWATIKQLLYYIQKYISNNKMEWITFLLADRLPVNNLM